jgi:hypothetical protein
MALILFGFWVGVQDQKANTGILRFAQDDDIREFVVLRMTP